MENKQLFEKKANSYNPIFPLVRLEDIIETISDKSIQWILNNYNHIYVEYSESVAITRNKVPSILRRNGLWISYNTGKDIITEWYKGKNVNINDYNQWTDDANWAKFEPLADGKVTYQHLSHALKQLMGKGNTITNFPDEEDITTNGTVLSFKDRDHDTNNFSGLGRVILRKNIILDDGVYKNILTQDMINKSNTIYEIRYDFDLNGGEITIPEDCVLDFQGGSLNNGNIKGFLLNDYLKPEWLGAKGDGIYDDTIYLINAINLCKKVICENNYSISSAIKIPSNREINGKGYLIASVKMQFMILCNSNSQISVNLDGNNFASGGIKINADSSNVNITNCEIKNLRTFEEQNFAAIGIDVSNKCSNISISECYIHDIVPYENGKVGDGPGSGTGIVVRQLPVKCNIFNCTFDTIKGDEDGDSIHLHSMLDNETYVKSDTIIYNCSFYNMYKRAIKLQCNEAEVRNCIFINNLTDDFNGVNECISIYGNNNIVKENTFSIEKCRYCINISGKENKILSNYFNIDPNTKYSNVLNSNPAIITSLGNSPIIKDNIFIGAKNTVIRTVSKNIVIDNNTFMANSNYAIFFEGGTCEEVIITNNIFKLKDYRYCISVYTGTIQNLIATNNTIIGNCGVFDVIGGVVSGLFKNNIAANSWKTITADSNSNISGLIAEIGQFRKEIYKDTPPSSSGFSKGDICINTNPSAGSYIGWVLTVNGWLGYGKIQSIT